MLILKVYVWYRDLAVSQPSHGLAIAWKLMVRDSRNFALPQDFKLSYLCYGVVYLCVAHLFTMILKAGI